MAGSAGGSGSAGDAKVQTGPPPPTEQIQAQRERYADEAEQAVKTIEAKLAGVKESLATAKAEAKRLRAEANEGAEG